MQLEAVQSGDGYATSNVSEGAGALREQLLGALSLALRVGDGSEGARDGGLRRLIQRASQSARERGLRAEQLLILLKETWRELPEVRHVPFQDADDMLARVVTLCIEEYYR
jgi:hypothetical protein